MKRILYLLAGLAFSFNAMAQNTNVTTKLPQNHNLEGGDNTDDNSGFGIKGGANFNQLRGGDKSSLSNLKNETNFHAGVYGQFPVKGSSFFSIQPEILFSRQGFTVADTTRKMDFVQVPLLFVFNFLDNVSFHIGPQAGVLMTVKENDKEVGESTKKLMNSFVYGAAAGVEARIFIARIGARYNLGLNDIYKSPERLGNQAVSDLKSGNFQVYLGVGF